MQLAQRRAAWSATRAAGLLDGLPPILSQRVAALLDRVDASEAALGAVLARQFALTDRASALQARIASGQADVAAAIDDIDRRLLRVDVPPLWQGLGHATATRASLDAMHRGLDIETRFARDYNAAGTANQQALRVVQLLLLPLILILVLRNKRGGYDAIDPDVRRALHRPVSTWLLLAMLSVMVLEPRAPLLVQEFALVLALVPVLRLLPSDTARWLGMPPYVAIGLYALDRVGVAAVADAGIYRLFLLALNALAFGLTLWMLRQPTLLQPLRQPTLRRPPALPAGRASRLQNTWLQRVRRPLGIVVAVTLAVAFACNIFGNISLAEMLTSGVIDSGYMALVLYASVAVCRGLLHLFLQLFSGQQLVHRQGPVLQAACDRLLVLAAVAGWLLYSLYRFRVLRPLHGFVTTVMGVGVDVGEVSVHLGDVLVFCVSIWLALWIARGVRRLLRDELPGHTRLPRGVGNSIASLSYYGVLVFGFLLALSAAGFQVSQLTIVFGALGVGIGFGLQNVVNNFVSGLVLMFERSIQPGDVVDAAGISGTVREIGLRATTIRTSDGADAVVPNGLLLSGNLTNWTMFDRSRRFEITVGVAYAADPAAVIALLRDVTAATDGVAADPAPVVLLTGYGESALNFIVRAWTADVAQWMTVRSDVLARALAALTAAGIEIPNQQIDINLRHQAAQHLNERNDHD
ncbi:MAG: mechanosensitive ion channel domain-containing protein, partial [Duganella sp.]